jgi:hypothetical protein
MATAEEVTQMTTMSPMMVPAPMRGFSGWMMAMYLQAKHVDHIAL